MDEPAAKPWPAEDLKVGLTLGEGIIHRIVTMQRDGGRETFPDIFAQPWRIPDAPFRFYTFTPFPRLSMVECRARWFAAEASKRASGAWAVLRGEIDLDQMHDDDECW